jgi:hypothetical protein
MEVFDADVGQRRPDRPGRPRRSALPSAGEQDVGVPMRPSGVVPYMLEVKGSPVPACTCAGAAGRQRRKMLGAMYQPVRVRMFTEAGLRG